MTRGFITIATGKKQYYEIAVNLLRSYRYFAKEKYPFAIIAEEENECTALFDDVILTNEAMHSFMDKLLLMKLCPYDETIFIDADSLAYGDLNAYWDFFEGATDFASLGANYPLDQKEGPWYNVEDIGKYGKEITYKTRVHSGVCFIRKSDKLKKLYDDCMDIFNHYDELYFHSFPNSVDECVLGVAMPMNQMKAVRQKQDMLAAYPCLTTLNADILHGVLQYTTPWGGYTEKGILLHWGTAQTYQPLYRYNVACLRFLLRNEPGRFWEKLLYEYRIAYYIFLCIYAFGIPFKLFKKCIRKIAKIASRMK